MSAKEVASKNLKNDLKFKLIFENSIDPILWADADSGIILACNRAACRLFGRSKEELTGIHHTELHPPAKRHKYATLFKEKAKPGTSGVVEAEIVRKDGAIRSVEITVTVSDLGGKTIVQGIFRDMTERKATERALDHRLIYSRAAAFSLSILVDNRDFKSKMHDIFAILLEAVSASRVYLFKNEEVEGKGLCQTQLFEKTTNGIEPQIDNSVLQKLPYSVLPKRLYETLSVRRPFVCSLGEYKEIDDIFISQGIKTILLLPIFCGPCFWGYIGFDDCVSFRKWEEDVLNLLQIVADGIGLCIMREELQNEKLALQEELFQAQKMESLGRLAGGMAHDFNNMISVINGYAYLLAKKLSPDSPVYKYALEIKKAGLLSAKLTKQLLLFARKVPCQTVLLPLKESISSILRMLKRLVGDNIRVVWHPPANEHFIMIAPTQFDQIIANLVINAKEAIKDSGVIKIELESALRQVKEPATGKDIAKKFAVIKVSDNGVGIPKELIGKIFDPFFTTKEKCHGTGLGLSTVFGIVKHNGGHIEVRSEQGKGACFEISLPEYSQSAPELKKEESVSEIEKGTGVVLVVDDSKSLLDLLKIQLEMIGYTAICSKNSKEALNMAKKRTESISILLSDFLLPGMNGKHLYDEIRKIIPTIKCLFMSACFSEFPDDISDSEILRKPFTIEELSQKLKNALDKQEHIRSL